MELQITWFVLWGVLWGVYFMLDGFVLGTGFMSALLAKNDMEKRVLINAVGPVWDGNEVWLLAGGGILYFAFPGLYSSSFSGFYLPLMIVLWLLIPFYDTRKYAGQRGRIAHYFGLIAIVALLSTTIIGYWTIR